MVISVASGKGGTGKTTIAVNLALSIKKDVQFLDCDVEEPNAHIFLNPQIKNQRKVYLKVPKIDDSKCNYCTRCSEACNYNAIAVIKPQAKKKGQVIIFTELCHGCGVCGAVCPQGAIKEEEKKLGVVETGNSQGLEFVQGVLSVGESIPSVLVREVKKEINFRKLVIIDSPPGTSCPVVASVLRSDFCILVTEPTPFGLNDLVLAVEMAKKLNVKFGVVINRSDLGYEKLEDYCQRENIPVLMRMPFKKEIAISYSKGIPLVKEFPEYKEDFIKLYEKIKRMIK